MTKTIITETFEDGKLVKRETVTENKPLKPLHAHILIDNSSSMDGWQDKVVNGVNEYVATLKQQTGEGKPDIFVSVSFFAAVDESPAGYLGWPVSRSILSICRGMTKIQEFIPLNRSDVRPNGWTPLYDAVGETVSNLEVKKDIDVVLVILTDGHENKSKKYTAAMVSETLKRKQERDNWAVLYLGANQDAWAVGSSIGTARGLTSGYSMGLMDVALGTAGAASARYAATRSMNSAQFTEAETSSMTEKK